MGLVGLLQCAGDALDLPVDSLIGECAVVGLKVQPEGHALATHCDTPSRIYIENLHVAEIFSPIFPDSSHYSAGRFTGIDLNSQVPGHHRIGDYVAVQPGARRTQSPEWFQIDFGHRHRQLQIENFLDLPADRPQNAQFLACGCYLQRTIQIARRGGGEDSLEMKKDAARY